MTKDGIQAHAKNSCGAKTRSGTPCKNYAMANGRCRMHGGKSTGPKNQKGNKNSLVTGENESIVFDYLDDDEKDLLSQIELDKLKQVDNEIKLIDIRLRRMMGRIAKLQENEMSISLHKVGTESHGDVEYTESEDNLSKIQNIEDAITRVQGQKLRLIKAKHDLEIDLDKGIDTEDKLEGYFGMLGERVDGYGR